MKLLTWNINGIRACKIKLQDLFNSLEADVICIQETKITRDQLDSRCAIIEGYNAYYSFSQARSGYSGVATFVKDNATPVKAEEGLTGLLCSSDDNRIGCYGDQSRFTEDELRSLDNEGRAVLTQHRISLGSDVEDLVTIINVYCPRADPERADRKLYKLRFYHLLQIRAQALLESGSHVIVLGDVNTSHRPIDSCDPGDLKEFAKHPGRRWLDHFLVDLNQTSGNTQTAKEEASSENTEIITPNDAEVNSLNNHKDTEDDDDALNSSILGGGKFVDTFRYLYPDKPEVYTCWNVSTGAREFNYGTRIDYIFCDSVLTTAACEDVEVLSDWEGSDHCPVRLTLSGRWCAANKCPPLCTKYMPEFSGKQQKLLSFFSRRPLKDKSSSHTSSDINCGSLSSSQSSGITLSSSQTSTLSSPQTDDETSQTNGCSGDEGTFSSSLSGAGDKASSFPSTIQTEAEKNSCNLKRDRTGSDTQPPSKKPKLEKSAPGVKQGNLLSFLSKPKAAQCRQSSVSTHSLPKADCDKSRQTPRANIIDIAAADVAGKVDCKEKAASAWKGLLCGPKAAPLCKSHKEPCVLRTVKKDGLNKGRQFYACARGEGPKSNPATRCEHFEWVDKKKNR